MNDQSRMCGQLSLWDTPNAISSEALASGPSLCDKPDGPMTRRFGQDHALASLSARQAKEAGLLTSGTSGPRFTFLSSSASLQSSLASRLQAATAMLGSTLYRMTWKQRVMPSGRLKPSLAASALRTSDPEITGWPTPQVADDNHSRAKDPQAYARWWLARPNAGTCTAAIAQAMTAWPTPTVGNANGSQMAKGASATGRRSDGSKATVSLNAVGQLSAWPTPDSSGFGISDSKWQERRAAIKAQKKNGNGFGLTIGMAATLTGWPTPSARDWKDTGDLSNSMTRADGKSRLDTVPRIASICGPARLTATGEMLTGSDAQTKSGGQLNPAHSLWLMLGPFATAWASCGERVMRSRSGKRKASSKP